MVKSINEVYKCNLCGNVVEVLFVGGGDLVCCGQKMELLEAKTGDAGMEKHTPVIEDKGDRVLVKVGRKSLKPGDKPEAEFLHPIKEILFAREYCNKHGLWKSA
jgi:superoxide reductase